jgi:hypothetical protein
VPEVERLDHDPSAAKILAAIRSGLGETRVLGAVRHDDQDAAGKLQAIHAGSSPLPAGWSWREQWQADPIDACVRCGEPAHTTGPDGRAWHSLCWAAAGARVPMSTYQAGTRLRPRVLALTGSVSELHRTIDALDRDTCLDVPCRPGAPCRRHVRRQRVEP